jgi:predicted aspartyl protease
MKMKTLLLSTVAVLALGGVANATDLVCGTPQFSVGRQSVDPQDTVNRIEIRHASNSREWQVHHRFVNGTMVMRQEQYAMVDASNPNFWAWRGRLKRNGAITMIGEVRRDSNGQIIYTETQSDGGRVTMKNQAFCNVVTAAELEAERQRKTAELEAERQRQRNAELEAERQRKKIEWEAEQERKKVEWEAEQKRKKVEWEAEQERKKIEWEAQQARIRDVLLNNLNVSGTEKMVIPLKVKGNVMRLNVGLGDQVLTMLLDTGASSSLITTSLAISLIRNDQAHFIGDTKFSTASGEVVRAKEVVIHEMKIGNQVVQNVKATAIQGDIDLLLGVDVLNAIGPYMIDSQKGQLIFAVASASKSETAEN